MAPKTLVELLAVATASYRNSAAAWLTPAPHIEVFTRIQHYRLDKPTLEHVVTIANVQVEADRRGQGIFTSYLAMVESTSGKTVVVENVHNPKLHSFLLKRGYTLLVREDYDESAPTYFKRKST